VAFMRPSSFLARFFTRSVFFMLMVQALLKKAQRYHCRPVPAPRGRIGAST
jgi:hypothetical protein